jgi:hypothetical protein
MVYLKSLQLPVAKLKRIPKPPSDQACSNAVDIENDFLKIDMKLLQELLQKLLLTLMQSSYSAKTALRIE